MPKYPFDDHDGSGGNGSRGRNGSRGGNGSGDPKPGSHGALGACPDPLTFAAFLEQRLTPVQQARVRAHVRQCPTCRPAFTTIADALLQTGEAVENADEVVDDGIDEAVTWVEKALAEELAAAKEWSARAARAATPPPPGAKRVAAVKRVPTAAVAAGIASVIALAAGFALGTWESTRDDRSPLASAPRERPYKARFTGSLPWAPAASGHHFAPTDYHLHLPPESIQYLMAAERRGTPPDAPSAAALGSVGSSQVLSGRLEPGVETLRRASAARPRSAELLSDLGGALLARVEMSDRRRADGDAGAAAEDRDADLPAALEAIERALEISPRLEEALFNRALALEWLHLRRSAHNAWQAYLDVDDSSPWADEARRRRAIAIPVRPDPTRLRSEIVAAAAGGEKARLAELVLAHRQLARRSVQEELLPGWGGAWLAGELEEADRQLHAAAAVAEEWEAQTSDRTLREAIAEVVGSTGGARGRLARGYRALGEASGALAAFELDAAQAGAEKALAALPHRSAAFTWAALVRLACVAYSGGEVQEDALGLASTALDDLGSVGRAHWIVGLQHAKRGDLATGLAILQQSLDAYERLDEADSIAWLHYLVGEAYGYMGAEDAGWRHRRLAVEHAPALTGGQRALAVLLGSAMLALYEERPRVAADLLDEALIEVEHDQPDQVAQAYLWRSRVLHELGRGSEARRDLQRAAAWLARAKPLERRLLGGDLDLAVGLQEVDPHRAVGRISRALARFRAVGPPWRLPGVLLARARAQLRAGDVAAADADLRQGLVLLDEQASGGIADAAWTRRLDGPEELFDERVQLALRQGDAEGAFAIAEASRARDLQALAMRGPRSRQGFGPTPLRLTEIQERLEPETTLLFYSWLPDRVVLWRLDRAGTRFVELQSTPAELGRLVAAFAADLEAGAWTTATRDTAKRLHAALLRPAELGRGPVVVIPDEALHGLPFAALIDPATRRFLVEEHELTVAPSAAAYLQGLARRQEARESPREALVVGDPDVDLLLFPGMRSLPGARQEARQVAALYPRRELLLGSAATREAFLAGLGQRAVVHFSGHAVSNRIDPRRSSLPLADDSNGPGGLLVASDIARLDLTGIRTVVLSGCETGVGEDRGGEGPLSLARAFLVAGVPNVVASLWPIADAPSAPLMTAFHRRLRGGEQPAAALRGAQLELLRGSERALRSPSVWGAFEAFGG